MLFMIVNFLSSRYGTRAVPKRAYRSSPSAFIAMLLMLCLTAIPIGVQAQVVNPADNNDNAEQVDDGGQSSGEESAADEDSGLDLGISELVDTAVSSEDWAGSVTKLLDDYGLSASLAGKLIATIGLALVFFLVFFILEKVLRKLLHKLQTSVDTISISFRRTGTYLSTLNKIVVLMMVCVYLMVLTGIWAENPTQTFIYAKSSVAFEFIATLGFLLALGALVFEVVSGVMDRVFHRWSSANSTRVQTLLPIARNVVNIALFLMLGITLISELGIDIMPLLAGAGVIGFAVGFGAQTLIKDLITGFIIIFEDLVQVGDVVTVGGKSGLVEKITIRKIQLRGLDGTVFTVPFSEIAIVENMTKEFSYYLMNVGVAYRESTDDVIEHLQAIGEEMQNEDDYKDLILAPIEILGVDSFADSAVIIKARIKTVPIKQWMVGREFNRRMKYRFDEAGIEIPFPHQTIYFGEDKNGKAPPANILLSKAEPANDSADDAAQKRDRSKDGVNSDGYKDDDDVESAVED
ncbi:mechanosensitive ion channel family protein [Teredinibacter turnerae]|uniref:mechanosensitive ion channel family protein n=1 Tax=Teredinibacter turnerae TaxID=2426 RepID=UPI00037D2058|nr:mechanosensitive ion channel family protein [Teredinibacter turnerae]